MNRFLATILTLLFLATTACSSGYAGAFPTGNELPGCEDVDGDGHFDAACGGNDCCDSDDASYPGAPAGEAPNACGSWDLDCNGNVKKGATEYGACKHVGASCDSADGFAHPTECGSTGTFIECSAACVTSVTIRTMECS